MESNRNKRRDAPDEARRAEDATDASRRERGDKRIEEQTGLGAGRKGTGKPRPF